MCDFCTKHGEGEIWYKNARNYAADLVSDLSRRRYIRDFLEATIGAGTVSLGRLETLYRRKKGLPARLVRAMVDKAREEHFGQVVPIEDVRLIIEKAATVVRMPCACRWAAEKKEKRCCYAVSYSPQSWHQELDMGYFGLLPGDGFETLNGAEAVAQMKGLEKEGAVHTIWTMVTPFIGAICNCTGHECLGLRTLAIEVPTLSRGEYVARVDATLCNGCGLCETPCPFAAISAASSDGVPVAAVDPRKCHGCGLCRNHCPQGALMLI